MREHEQPIPFPVWRRRLHDYHRAFETYHANPVSIVTTAFLDRAIVQLDEAYREPGKFPLGLIALSSGACNVLSRDKHLAEEFLIRHKNGDWGNVSDDEAGNNLYAVTRDYQITSKYETRTGSGVWVMTYGNRAATHLYVPEEH